MKKRLVQGMFSSVPMAALLTETLDISEENEVKDSGEATEGTDDIR
jgi:hypothetical protein